MSENPAGQGTAPEEPEHDSASPAEPLAVRLDPDFIPDRDPASPEEKTTRGKPEETGS